MNVYMLIDKKSGEVVNVYKYEEAALSQASREGIVEAVSGIWSGKKNPSKNVVEVRKLIE